MLRAENLVKRFEDKTALDGLNTEIRRGCIYGLVGPNGSGKSTLMRLMCGVYRPDGGRVTLEGEDIFENIAAKDRILYLSDDLYFPPKSTVEDLASFYRGLYSGFSMETYHTLCGCFPLQTDQPLSTFSKGMRRQAATILAISCRPDYIFFDETFDGLDPVMRNLVKSMICQDVLERGATAIITSHSLRELEDTCDQLALLHQGGIVLESDIQDLKTSLFKVQIAFPCEYDREFFRDIDVVHFSKRGSVANLIVRGDREETAARLQRMQPSVLDILPLTLEEVFTYEMEALGYAFGDLLPQ